MRYFAFNHPFFVFFISLDKDAVPTKDINIQGLRLGLNGKEVGVGQLFANMDITINAENYDSAVFLEAGSFQVGGSIGDDITIESGNALCYGETAILDTQLPAALHVWYFNGEVIPNEISSTLDLDKILNTVYFHVNQMMDANVFCIGFYKYIIF